MIAISGALALMGLLMLLGRTNKPLQNPRYPHGQVSSYIHLDTGVQVATWALALSLGLLALALPHNAAPVTFGGAAICAGLVVLSELRNWGKTRHEIAVGGMFLLGSIGMIDSSKHLLHLALPLALIAPALVLLQLRRVGAAQKLMWGSLVLWIGGLLWL